MLSKEMKLRSDLFRWLGLRESHEFEVKMPTGPGLVVQTTKLLRRLRQEVANSRSA